MCFMSAAASREIREHVVRILAKAATTPPVHLHHGFPRIAPHCRRRGGHTNGKSRWGPARRRHSIGPKPVKLTAMTATVAALFGGFTGATATVLAQTGIAWLRRPRLVLNCDRSPDGPPEAVITESAKDGRHTAFMRLPVHNQGRVSARNVTVLVVAVDALDGPDPAGNVATLPLKWADAPTETLDIPPKVWRLVDLVHTRSPRPENLLGVWPEHEDERRVLSGDCYRLTLAATAADTPARFWELVVSFPGTEWSDDAVWEVFRVESCRRLRRRPSAGYFTSREDWAAHHRILTR